MFKHKNDIINYLAVSFLSPVECETFVLVAVKSYLKQIGKYYERETLTGRHAVMY